MLSRVELKSLGRHRTTGLAHETHTQAGMLTCTHTDAYLQAAQTFG